MLKTQEFADLCSTTKETLFHYDRIGLLKPKVVKSNGYRLYNPKQCVDFMTISVLKDAGCSLKEIQLLRQNGSVQKVAQVLEERKKSLKKQIKALESSYRSLSDLAASFSEKFSENVEIRELEKQKYLLTPCKFTNLESVDEFGENLKNFRAAALAKEENSLPLGCVYDSDLASQGRAVMISFFSDRKSKADGTLTKMKAGKYAVWAVNGTAREHAAFMTKALQSLEKDGYTIAGNVYSFDQPEFLTSDSASDVYLARYLVALKAPKPSKFLQMMVKKNQAFS